jgi:hypothetical protein
MGHMGCRLKEEEARLEMQRRSLGMLQQAWWVCTLELMERSVKIRKQIFTAVFFHLEALFKGATASAQNGYMELRAQNGQLFFGSRQEDISQTSGIDLIGFFRPPRHSLNDEDAQEHREQGPGQV